MEDCYEAVSEAFGKHPSLHGQSRASGRSRASHCCRARTIRISSWTRCPGSILHMRRTRMSTVVRKIVTHSSTAARSEAQGCRAHLEAIAAMADTYARGTMTRAHGLATVSRPMDLRTGKLRRLTQAWGGVGWRVWAWSPSAPARRLAHAPSGAVERRFTGSVSSPRLRRRLMRGEQNSKGG